MLYKRSMYEGSFTLPFDRMNEFDPKEIAPIIAIMELCHSMLNFSTSETVAKMSMYLLKFCTNELRAFPFTWKSLNKPKLYYIQVLIGAQAGKKSRFKWDLSF